MRTPRSDIVPLGLAGLLALTAVVIAGCRSTQSDPQRPGLRVRPGVAFEMAVDAPDMPVIDLRRPDEYDGPLGHLPRSWNLPLEELPGRLPEIRWMRGVTFVVYCRGYDWDGKPSVETGAPERQSGTSEEVSEPQSVEVSEPQSVEVSVATPQDVAAASGEVTPEDAAEDRPEPRAERYRDVCGEEAIRFLLGQGFLDAVLLEGGIAAWLDDGYSTVGRGGQGPYMDLPDDPGLRVPPGAKSIGDPRYLPEPP